MLIALLCGTLAAASGQAGRNQVYPYRVVDLGTLPGCDVTYAKSVNDTGWVVGYAYKFVGPDGGDSQFSRPFLWRNGVMTELKKLGGRYGRALVVSSKGDVGGYAEGPDYAASAVVWHAARGPSPA